MFAILKRSPTITISRCCAWSMASATTTRRVGFYSFSSSTGRKYTKDHEWLELESGGQVAKLGITDYAQKALGDVVYAEIVDVGNEVEAKGESMHCIIC